MALPKKGSRKIIVGGSSYRWTRSVKPDVFEIRVEDEINPAQSLFARIPNKIISSVTPRLVSMVIEQGLRLGWSPSINSKKPFVIELGDIDDLLNELEVTRPKAIVRHEIVKKSGLIRVRKFKQNGYENFRIRLYIDGPLDKIHFVEYELHPSFSEPLRTSKEPSNGFSIEFWTWGEFEVLVVVHYFDGHKERLSYDLKYSSDLSSQDSDYMDETPESLRG